MIVPSFAEDPLGSNDIIAKMTRDLDLQQDQISNITPIIEKYSIAFADLQKSINDGTINPSAVDSQKQGLEAQETQELSPYLKPDQLSRWGSIQGQIFPQKDKDSGDENTDTDQYSNMPNH